MATGNQNNQPRVINAHLQPNTVDLAVLSAPGQGVAVTNVSGTAPIYFTVDHPGGACTAPMVDGTYSFCVASVAGAREVVNHDGQFGSVVQLISAGSVQYTVAVTGRTTNA